MKLVLNQIFNAICKNELTGVTETRVKSYTWVRCYTLWRQQAIQESIKFNL
jgi:hypothetical protein